MAVQRLVVIGASSGGLEALRTIASGLPAGFPAPICVVVHSAPDAPGVLAAILDRAGPLRAITAATDMRLENGRIFVAPPDWHLLVEPGLLRLSRGPKENRFRPAVDPLFRSAAQVFGPAAIGVVLTGSLDDGTAGLWAIKRLGGVAIVQDPLDALFPSMPQSAMRHVDVDHVLPLSRIAPALLALVTTSLQDAPRPAVPPWMEVEMKIARGGDPIAAGLEEMAEPSRYACPECHGVLLRLKEAQPLRFRCHTGHAYSTESLLAAVRDGIEEALWNALRAIEERALLLDHLAMHAPIGNEAEDRTLADQARAARRQAQTLREMVEAPPIVDVPSPAMANPDAPGSDQLSRNQPARSA